MADVAERYALGLSALKRRAKAESWVDKRAKMALDVTASVLERAREAEIENEQERQMRLARIWDHLVGQLERCVIEQIESDSPDRAGLRALVSILRELQGVQIPVSSAAGRVIIIDDIPREPRRMSFVVEADEEDAGSGTAPEARFALDCDGGPDTLGEAMAGEDLSQP